MSKNTKSFSINDKEKKWITQTTVIIREVLKENIRTKKNNISDILKHPLLLLLVGALISGIIVYKYQSNQAKSTERVKAKYELLKEISSVTGKLLAMAEEVLNLHQKPIDFSEQIDSTNKAYNEAYEAYKSNFYKIEYSLRFIFKHNNYLRGWSDIRLEFIELDNFLEDLNEFKTTNISFEHSKRIDQCKNKILVIIKRFNLFSNLLIENLD